VLWPCFVWRHSAAWMQRQSVPVANNVARQRPNLRQACMAGDDTANIRMGVDVPHEHITTMDTQFFSSCSILKIRLAAHGQHRPRLEFPPALHVAVISVYTMNRATEQASTTQMCDKRWRARCHNNGALGALLSDKRTYIKPAAGRLLSRSTHQLQWGDAIT